MVFGFLYSSVTYAVHFYADALYWQASETVDWSLTNNLNRSNQRVAYNTIAFDYDPGFRIGIGLPNEKWSSRFIYTRFHSKANEATNGNVVSAFIGSKVLQPFYQAGQARFKIDFNMFDADIYKAIMVDESLIITPLIGLKGGWINQDVDAGFQGAVNVEERISNDFYGVGPKAGVEAKWIFFNNNRFQYGFVSDVFAAYLWGHWSIHDLLYQNNSVIKFDTVAGKRDFGAFAAQALIGIQLDYNHQYSINLGYEISDWFNQYQVLDDATGAHSNDLILQGLTLALHCQF